MILAVLEVIPAALRHGVMVCPRFVLAIAIVCVTLPSSWSIAEAVDLGQLEKDAFLGERNALESESILDFDSPPRSSDWLKRSHLLLQPPPDHTAFALRLEPLKPSKTAELAQGIDLETYQQLFIPQHRHQPGRQPFEPTQVPLQQPSSQEPGVSLSTPSGYGLAWRSLGIGVGIQSRTRYSHRADGTLGVGLGFGNPTQAVGLQVGLGLVDVTDPFADGTISLKLHRQLPEDIAIAIGGNGVLTWGSPDGGTSFYGVVTKRFTLKESSQAPFSQITTSLGVGSGQFRSESAVNQNQEGVGVFGSVAVRLAEPVSGIVEWTGQDLNLGVSLIPFRKIPLVITPSVNDITGSAGDGARFVVGIGYGLNF
ncbi:MAG: hypothetical protein ACO31I_05990 [Prochlorotrichaceae cyanobacterium]|jgi:hypothetical protein